jgi:hypothetical protein
MVDIKNHFLMDDRDKKYCYKNQLHRISILLTLGYQRGSYIRWRLRI